MKTISKKKPTDEEINKKEVPKYMVGMPKSGKPWKKSTKK
jgi:hypothetical protein